MSELVSIERVGGKIKLNGFLSRTDSTTCERIPGAQFVNRAGASWSFPLTLTTCAALRSTFGDRLVIGTELRAWAFAARTQQESMANLATADDTELDYLADVAPRAAASIRNYQRVAAAFIAAAGCVLITDEQGLGKCIETLAGNIEAEQGCGERLNLIFAPLIAVSTVWPGEIRQWIGERARVVQLDQPSLPARREALVNALSAGHKPGQDLYVVTNIEFARIKPDDDGKFKLANAVAPELFSIEWDAIVVDECHKALIRTSGKPTQARAGFEKLRSKRRIALSGTPMRGKPEQLWGTLHWLRPDLYTSYWNWVEQYFKLGGNGFSDYVIDGWQPDGKARMAADLATISLRRTKAEVLSELPAKSYAGTYLIPDDDQSPHGIWLSPNERQVRQLDQLEADGVIKGVRGAEVDEDEIVVNGHLAERTRARQLASAPLDANAMPVLPCPKFDWLVNKLDEIGIRHRLDTYGKRAVRNDDEGDAKIVVAAFSTRLINAFAQQLERKHGIASYVLTGETSAKRRQAMVEDFQSDQNEVRVFLMNAQAGGVGVTLDAADDLVLLDESGIPDDKLQVEDRVHRASRMHQVVIHQLRTLGTIEEEIAWVAAARQDVQQYLLDGSRGMEYARRIYLDSTKTSKLR